MLRLFKEYPRYMLFGLITMYFSSFGQTFLLSLFNKGIEQDYNISNQLLSTIYSAATLSASFALPYFGMLMDRKSVVRFGVIVSLILCLFLSLITLTHSLVILFLCFVFIRMFGQSVLPMTATTFLTRYFGEFRGRAMSFCSFGRSISEGTLPALMALCMGAGYGWVMGPRFLVGLLLFVYIPILIMLFRKGEPSGPLYPEHKESKHQDGGRVYTTKEILRIPQFYFIALANTTLPFIMTGIYFQQHILGTHYGWSTLDWSSAFIGYSIAQLGFNLISGFLIDKYTARRILPVTLIPLLIGLLMFRFFDGNLLCQLAMLFFGISIGFASNVRSAFFAEAFGVNSLGAIKSLDGMLMVISTALAPIFFSYVLEYLGAQTLINILSTHAFVGICAYSLLCYLYSSKK